MVNPEMELIEGERIPIAIGDVAEVRALEQLGEGGGGSMWKVQDQATGRLYALKIIRNASPDSQEIKRARLEAGVRIPSEHVVPVVGFREWTPGVVLILFEYFRAQTLRQRLPGGLDGSQKRAVFLQTLRGVADAHRCNIIHRDLKPENILVGENDNGDFPHVKLIDFGVSKFKDRRLTMTGDLLGTPQYAPPEMLMNPREVDKRADIYALGHMLYELAVGHSFWSRHGWTRAEDLIAYITGDPPPTEGVNCDGFECGFLPDAVPNAAALLAKMVKLKPAERYNSVEQILADLAVEPVSQSRCANSIRRNLSPALIVESGDNRDSRLILSLADGETRVIGRQHLAGADLSISKRHLEISREGNDFYLRDAGSRNGTFQNGLALGNDQYPTLLAHGDRIKVGDIFLRVEFEEHD